MPVAYSSAKLKAFADRAPECKPYLDHPQIKKAMQFTPPQDPPMQYLVRAIVYQQLSGKAAGTIFGRFTDLIGEVTSANILKFSEEKLRTVGLSRQKANYVQNVARAFAANGDLSRFNDRNTLQKMSSEEIIKQFTSIKGVGEWTVQMYLLFALGRLDVLAAKDLGVQKGIQKIYGLEELPKPKQVKEITKHWGDLASIGSFLAWRVLEIDD